MQTYIIRAGDSGPVKIGKAGNIPYRLSTLQTAHYEELRVIRIISGDVELAFHHHFRPLRIRREWFRFDPEMLTFLPEPDALLNEYRKALDMRPVCPKTTFLADVSA